MNSTIVILRASRYNFKDKEKDKEMRGTKVTFVQSLDVEMTDDTRGVDVMTSTIPYEDFGAITEAPAVYSADLRFKANSKGVPVVSIHSLEYIGVLPR
jgi:hypothetical protein